MIVDDGSHRVEHIMKSLNYLWPVLKPGGVYIMEVNAGVLAGAC